MKNLFIFLFVSVSSILYSQNQTTDSLVCIENDSLSFYQVPCMDCYENKNLLSRKCRGVYLSPKLEDDKNKAYSEGAYLLGTLKDGKPYNGFFLNMSGQHIELPIFDFYEEGNLVYQLYNDLFEGITEERFEEITEEDIEVDTRILNKKNTFKNNKIWEGIQIYPEPISWKGAEVTLITDFKEGKEEKINLVLAAMHYGGLITISNLENGYYFNHWGGAKIKVSYFELGSKIELIDPKNKVFGSIKNEYVKFSKKAKEDQLKNKVLFYYIKNNQLFINKRVEEFLEFQDEDRIPSSAFLKLIENLPYDFTPIKTKEAFTFLNKGCWIEEEIIGAFFIEGGKSYGIDVEEASEEGKYNASYYDEGKLISVVKNKTPAELLEIRLKQIEKEKEEEDF